MTDLLKWYELKDDKELVSPALLIYPDRVKTNAKTMIQVAKDPQRLWPHIKTHKMAEIVDIQKASGIDKYKCATLTEAELLSKCRVKEILLAMQPVSINIKRLCDLMEKYPETTYSTLVDCEFSFRVLKEEGAKRNLRPNIWIDINNGMNRTGIKPGDEAKKLYKWIADDPEFNLRGLHVYDGHIRDSELSKRQEKCDKDFSLISQMKNELERDGYMVKEIIAGGSPSFPVHALRDKTALSPGTCLLWDAGYGSKFPDMNFIPAAVLFTRIISKPDKDLLCFDLGHKSVASEMSFPRVKFLGNHSFEQVSQSEEHLVVKCKDTDKYTIGEGFYALPMHICPTVAKYPKAITVENNSISGQWKVAARDHLMN
jgi:D-serine deaminase-like pyridoxal phosphate-dependent protein